VGSSPIASTNLVTCCIGPPVVDVRVMVRSPDRVGCRYLECDLEVGGGLAVAGDTDRTRLWVQHRMPRRHLMDRLPSPLMAPCLSANLEEDGFARRSSGRGRHEDTEKRKTQSVAGMRCLLIRDAGKVNLRCSLKLCTSKIGAVQNRAVENGVAKVGALKARIHENGIS
jgi:hypothetical protein